MKKLLVLFSILIGTSCVDTPAYYFAPEAANVTRAGMATHVENIPQESPQGTVEISTMGITKGQRGERGLHVRMAIDNEGDDTPWTLDIRDQQVEIPGIGRSQPQFANAGVQTLPTITVPRRERRVLDLYFPVPPNVHDADDLVGFDFLWQVTTPKRVVSSRTHIDRLEAAERADSTVYVTSWGPYWWYDPWYPRVVYRTIYVAPVVRVHRHH
jgi:hypothetical protein